MGGNKYTASNMCIDAYIRYYIDSILLNICQWWADLEYFFTQAVYFRVEQ